MGSVQGTPVMLTVGARLFGKDSTQQGEPMRDTCRVTLSI